LFPVPVPVLDEAVADGAAAEVAAPDAAAADVAAPDVAVLDSMIRSTRSAEPTTPMVRFSAAWRCP
jgi:hypothetical protein